jgi:hypothetical protein
MAETKKITTIYFILITLLAACQEVYYPDDIDATLKIPVIEGYIHDGPGPYTVKLFWATEFNENSNNPIKNARVTISDNFGHSAVLKEINNGIYKSNQEDISGTPGRLYTLRVDLEDGSIYESISTLMQAAEEIDSIYAEIGEKESFSKNYYGELIIKKMIGLHVYVSMNSGSGNKRFFRFYNKLISQTHHYVYLFPEPDTLFPGRETQREPVDVYCWGVHSLDDIVNIKSTFNSNSEQVIKRHNLGFLQYEYNSIWPDDTTSPPIPRGWIITTTAYSISENAFEYYNSVVKQLTAKERIFDPIPSQIKGNLHCLSDTSQIVLGLFEVASRTVKHTAFNWWPGRNTYDILNLPEYTGPAYSSCQDSIMPDFWITFY